MSSNKTLSKGSLQTELGGINLFLCPCCNNPCLSDLLIEQNSQLYSQKMEVEIFMMTYLVEGAGGEGGAGHRVFDHR